MFKATELCAKNDLISTLFRLFFQNNRNNFRKIAIIFNIKQKMEPVKA